MTDENAIPLNRAGIDHVQVASSAGCSSSYISYQYGGEWYTLHYDSGYQGGWNSTPSLDAYAPTESSWTTGPNGYGGSGCGGYYGGIQTGSNTTNNVYLQKGLDYTLTKLAKILYGVTNMGYGLMDGMIATTKALKGLKGLKVVSPINLGVSFALTAPIMISEYIDYSNGEITPGEYAKRTGLTAAEFVVPAIAAILVAANIIGAPVFAYNNHYCSRYFI